MPTTLAHYIQELTAVSISCAFSEEVLANIEWAADICEGAMLELMEELSDRDLLDVSTSSLAAAAAHVLGRWSSRETGRRAARGPEASDVQRCEWGAPIAAE